MEKLLAGFLASSRARQSKPVSVLFAYEDLNTGARAEEFCRRVAKELGTGGEIRKRMWLFSEFRLPRLRAIAAEEAALSDLVALSVHNAQELPEEIQAWLSAWMTHPARKCSFVAALFDPVLQGDPEPIRSYLREKAQAAKVEFSAELEEIPESPFSM